MVRSILLSFLICLTLAGIAKAESLVVTLSERTVDITSNFTGSAITVFGAVRRDAATVPRASGYDLVVTVVGPQSDQVARLKERTFGVWINRGSAVFEDVPSAYQVLSNRPVEDIAHPALLRRFQIGVNHLFSDEDTDFQEEEADDEEGDEDASQDASDAASPASQPALDDHVFEQAFLRLQQEADVYREVRNGVEVIDNNLFRARATFPADVPLGLFDVNVYLFSGGVLLAQEQVGILVRKTGFEQVIFRTSQRDPLLYGALAVLIAVFTGWLGSVVFRRS